MLITCTEFDGFQGNVKIVDTQLTYANSAEDEGTATERSSLLVVFTKLFSAIKPINPIPPLRSRVKAKLLKTFEQWV